MPMSEITINGFTISFENSLWTMHVLAGFGGMSLEWPLIIHDEKSGKDFKFVCNETMEPWMANKYSGHAKYIEIDKSLTKP